MQSKYKTLLVSGCSFTHNNCEDHFAWGNDLAVWTGMNIINLAIPGAGNTHISNSIMLYIEQHDLDPAETLVMAMWSGVARIDWIADKSLSKFRQDYPFGYDYDQHSELVLGGTWWNRLNGKTHIKRTLIEYSKYQTEHTLSLSSWLAMNNLSNYLKLRGFEHYYTSILDHGFNEEELWVDYEQELKELNLSLDKSNWVYPCIGNYCQDLNMIQDDKFHPTMQGQESWTRTVLMPFLAERAILHDR
jgi:hypothetical protein